MWFHHGNKRQEELDKKEAQIQAVHQDTLKKIDVSVKKTEKLNNLIEGDAGVTRMIFLATGGSRRK